jgi:hypothetical protein
MEFNGDRTKAKAFWNSVELYICLAPQQFESEYVMIAWVFSFMKSGHAALFVDCVLRHEARTGLSEDYELRWSQTDIHRRILPEE